MATKTYVREFAHQEPGKEYGGISGYYVPKKEVRLSYQGREVLYVRGHAVVESSCCGSGNWDYVLVPGYIINWHCRKNTAFLWVTDVEPVVNSLDIKKLTGLIEAGEETPCITFW